MTDHTIDVSTSQVQESVRVRARAAMGFSSDGDPRSFREIAHAHGTTLYPAYALLALSSAQLLTGSSYTLFPEISRTLGFGPSYLMVTNLLAQAIAMCVPLFVARYIGERPRRAAVTVAAAILFAIGIVFGGFAPTAIVFAIYSMIDAATSVASNTASGSLVLDLYPPPVRVRAFATLSAATSLVGILMPLVIIICTSVFGLTWRGVYLVTGVGALLLVLFASRLRDPGFGHHDRDELVALIDEELGEERAAPAKVQALPAAKPTLLEVYRAMWAVRTVRLSFIGTMVAGLTAPLGVALSFYFANALDYSPTDLALQTMFSQIAALGGIIILAPYGDRIFRRSPRVLYWISAGLSLVGSMVLLIHLVVDSKTANMGITALVAFLSAFIGPASAVGGMSLIAPEHRHYVGSIYAMVGLVGTSIGTAIFANAARSSLEASIVSVALAAMVGALLTGLAGESFVQGLDQGNDRMVEDLVVRNALAAGHRPPIVECTGVTASYGSVQVLHGIDMRVEAGEMVALLGLNGSGKSTLLKVMCGLERPTRGSIRTSGYDITHACVERRVANGIVLMRGGHAVFPTLSVRQNLATAVVEGESVSDAIDEALMRFPDLAPLADRPAGVISGGEAQMLGLARAILLRPRLLLIDELSLGLAPRVVGDLVEQVRALNRAGTSVVVVEQSLNLAAELAERAVFLDRGRVRFDGPIAELATRGDLVRAIFLREGL